MERRALNIALAILAPLAVIAWLLVALLVWCYGSPELPTQERDVPIIYDEMAYTLVIEEPTGRSWREYADGSVEIITEGRTYE